MQPLPRQRNWCYRGNRSGDGVAQKANGVIKVLAPAYCANRLAGDPTDEVRLLDMILSGRVGHEQEISIA